MKRKIPFVLLSLLSVGSAFGQSPGVYYSNTDPKESLPIKWVVGTSAIYDSNVSPGSGPKSSSLGINPSVVSSFTSISPQTIWDVYVRLGLIYYLDAPSTMKTTGSQSRASVAVSHHFSERLRFTSTNFISYELEPDYSYGYASSRQAGAYFYLQSDNSVGFRWTERFATYTGLRLSDTSYPDLPASDSFTWEAYNQFRYQLSPQSLLTADLRYSQMSAKVSSSDANDFYLLGGMEHRFSTNSVGVMSAGAQVHSVNQGNSYTSPYVEFALNSQVTKPFSVRSFARYGIQGQNNTMSILSGGLLVPVQYNDQRVFRLGVTSTYALSPIFSLFSGIDYIPTNYAGGFDIATRAPVSDSATSIYNAYIGLSVKFNDYLTGTTSYNYTYSSSDVPSTQYTRGRINVGLSAAF